MYRFYLIRMAIDYCVRWKRWDFIHVYELLKGSLCYIANTKGDSKNYYAKQCHGSSQKLLTMHAVLIGKRIRGSYY